MYLVGFCFDLCLTNFILDVDILVSIFDVLLKFGMTYLQEVIGDRSFLAEMFLMLAVVYLDPVLGDIVSENGCVDDDIFGVC